MKFLSLITCFILAVQLHLGAQTVIWSDDFSDPGNWTTTIWPGAPNTPWVIGTTPAQGAAPVPQIQSTTANNGFALLDSDLYGSATATEFESSMLTTVNPIDLSAHVNVILEFQTFYRKWNFEECFVVVSTSNSNWPDLDPDVNVDLWNSGSSDVKVYRAFPGMQTQEPMDNPSIVRLNISEIAGGQPQVWIRFHWTGTWGYSWYVDDVAILQQPEHDLELTDAGIANTSGGIQYGRIPTSHISGTHRAMGSIYNFGYADPTNAQSHVRVADPNAIPVHVDDEIFGSIASGDTLWIEHVFTLGQLEPGLHVATLELSSNEEQLGSMYAGDNTITQTFEVTTDRFSIDNIGNHPGTEFITSLGTNSFENNSEGMMMMSQYSTNAPLTVHGLEIMLQTGPTGTTAGGMVMIALYDSADIHIDQLNWTPDLSSPIAQIASLYTITSADIAAGKIQLTFGSPITLPAGSYYAAMEAYAVGISDRVRILDDATVEQPAWASLIYLPFDGTMGGNENRIWSNGNAFAIRLITEPTVINPDPCEALFNVTQGLSLPDSIPVPGLLWILDASNGGSGNYSYTWEMGDGAIYNEPTPYHEYATNGPYDLCLTIDDGAGCTDTYCQSIWVDDQGVVFGFTFDGSRSEGFGVQVIPAIPTAIASLHSSGSAMALWPNPVEDLLNVELNGGSTNTFMITDAIGRTVKVVPASGRTGRFLIDVSSLANGTYTLHCMGAEARSVSRFIKVSQ